MRVAIVGLGYVGLTAAACFTKQGHSVFGVDSNESKIRDLQRGVSPLTEPGLDELLGAAIGNGSFECSSSLVGKLDDCDVAFVTVGTPSSETGALNMRFVAEVTRQIAVEARSRTGRILSVVYRSTFRPGTMEELVAPIVRSVLKDAESKLELVYHPEFLREATAIADFFKPPKVVIGTEGGRRSNNLYELNSGFDCPIFEIAFREAEIIKFIDNSFHATKIAFANEIGRLCDALQLRPEVVHQMFVSDTKLNVSPAYLTPGGPFGGSCLPKDVRALQHLGEELGIRLPLVDSLIASNNAHKQFAFEACRARLPVGGRVLMLGLGFKKGSDDLRNSPQIDLARRLVKEGYVLSIFDPSIVPEKLLGQNLGYAYGSFPDFSRFLVGEEVIKQARYDLVVDTSGYARTLDLADAVGPLLNLDRLQLTTAKHA